MRKISATLALAAGMAFAAPALISSAFAGPAENKANAIAFLDTIFNQGKVDEAFSKYVGDKYIQHNPRVPDGIEGGKKALGGMLAGRKPGWKYEVIKAVAGDDYAVVHAHSYAPGEKGSAVVDWFRFENGKIVEHWDVIQEVPDQAANNNTMFGK